MKDQFTSSWKQQDKVSWYNSHNTYMCVCSVLVQTYRQHLHVCMFCSCSAVQTTPTCVYVLFLYSCTDNTYMCVCSVLVQLYRQHLHVCMFCSCTAVQTMPTCVYVLFLYRRTVNTYMCTYMFCLCMYCQIPLQPHYS